MLYLVSRVSVFTSRGRTRSPPASSEASGPGSGSILPPMPDGRIDFLEPAAGVQNMRGE